jgi:hypothetical protein
MADPSQFATLISGLSDDDALLLKSILSDSANKSGDPNAFLFSVAKAGLPTADVAYVKQRFRSFLQRIVDLSRAAQPPGAHAASGFFHDWMVTDGIIASLGGPSTVPLGPEAQPLFDVYLNWYNYVLNAVFKRADNVEAEDIGILIEGVLGDVIKFAVDVFNAVFGNQQQRQQAIDSISREIGPLLDHLNANGHEPFKGRHMSGWIAKFSSDTAFFSLTFLNQRVPLGTSGGLGRIADVIRAMFSALNQIPFDGMNPWLKGAWQLQYQATLQSAIVGLDAIQTLPLRKQNVPDMPTEIGPLLGPNVRQYSASAQE